MSNESSTSNTNEFTCQVQYNGSDARLNIKGDEIAINSSYLVTLVNIPIEQISTMELTKIYKRGRLNKLFSIILGLMTLVGIFEIIFDRTFFIQAIVAFTFFYSRLINSLIYPFLLKIVVNYKSIELIYLKKENIGCLLNRIHTKRQNNSLYINSRDLIAI